MSEKALCEVNMTYATMRSYFRAAERARQHLSGFIVFSPASFISAATTTSSGL